MGTYWERFMDEHKSEILNLWSIQKTLEEFYYYLKMLGKLKEE